jgi:hypothetical protein
MCNPFSVVKTCSIKLIYIFLRLSVLLAMGAGADDGTTVDSSASESVREYRSTMKYIFLHQMTLLMNRCVDEHWINSCIIRSS